MKKMIAFLTAFVLIAGLASAQNTDTTSHRGWGGRKMAMQRHGRGGDMMRKLNLTDDQKTQLKAVNEDYRKQLTALQSNNSITLGDYKTQLAALHKSHKEQVSNIYTAEQKKMLADRRQNAQRQIHARGAANLDKMKQNLGLTDDQVAKIKTQREDLKTKMKGLRENTALLPEERRTQMKELFVQQKEQLKTVLTADQLSKLEAMRKDRATHRGGFRQEAK